MISQDVIREIEDFVSKSPRSIDEIAKKIGRNWRTADRYVTEINKEYGTISTRVFREGTRGALKIVFWSSIEKINNSIFQEKLEEDIIKARRKEDFSAFDIYQFVDKKNKQVKVIKSLEENKINLKDLQELILSTKKELLIFSGNLSFVNISNKEYDLFSAIEKLVKNNIKIKVLCRVDIAGKSNIEKLLSLNFKYGKDLIQIKNRDHPIRAFIVDKKIFRIKEIKEPTGKINELDKKLFIFYTIKDKVWAEWLSNIFNKLFLTSIDANTRLEQMKALFR